MTALPQRNICLVIPVYNEERVLPELFRRLDALFDAQSDYHFNVVLINDGSRDASADLITARAASDERFIIINLSRNFGHQAALTAGLAHARGDAIVTMDCDLQDPPEIIPLLLAKWNEGADVVLATRTSRQETGLRRLGFDLFHRFFALLSDFPIEANTGTFGLLSSQAHEAFKKLPETHRFFPGLRSWIGFQRAEVTYERQERAAGQPKQTLRRLVRYAMDGVFSFSRLPLRALTYVGVVVALSAFIIGMWFVIHRLTHAEIAPTGFTTLVTLILFLGGVQLIGIGVLGEYLGRVYEEVKRRPHYILKSAEGNAAPFDVNSNEVKIKMQTST